MSNECQICYDQVTGNDIRQWKKKVGVAPSEKMHECILNQIQF